MAGQSGEKSLVGEALPPLLFPGANSTERRRLAQLKAAGRIRPVGPRLYVSVPEAETEFARVMIRAQQFSNMEFSPYPRILKELTRRNWFREPDEARIVEGPLLA